MYTYTYIYTCVYIYVYIYMHIHKCIYTYMHTFIYIYTHTYIHIHVYIYIYTYTYVYIYIFIHTVGVFKNLPEECFFQPLPPSIRPTNNQSTSRQLFTGHGAPWSSQHPLWATSILLLQVQGQEFGLQLHILKCFARNGHIGIVSTYLPCMLTCFHVRVTRLISSNTCVGVWKEFVLLVLTDLLIWSCHDKPEHLKWTICTVGVQFSG